VLRPLYDDPATHLPTVVGELRSYWQVAVEPVWQRLRHNSCHHRVDLAGMGIVLVPCGFTWPTLTAGCCGFQQPVLIYPPRGVAAVSQHLKILKDTALVTARRRGRLVLYQQTAAAIGLLAAIRSGETAG
jgi:hypothetical protein